MRIVEINTVCDTGSTGRVAAGVARLAMKAGHDVYFAYGRGKHPDDIKGYRIGNPLDFVCHVLVNFFGGKSGFGSSRVTKLFLSWLDLVQPDVIHIHNLHGFYINIELLFNYIKERDIAVIWTLHDCWSFTGQCAYFDYANCDKWKTECFKCPIYRKEYPYSLFCDNSRGNYISKKAIFANVKTLTIVTPSIWLKNLAKESFLGQYNIEVINNGIDLRRFYVVDEEDQKQISELRMKYGISADNRIVLGVANVWSNRKGLREFCMLSDQLGEMYTIVLIGLSDLSIWKLKKKYRGRILGIRHTESIEELTLWYNTADVYINPTFEDNLPTTNIEALACGTPVITYATGGSAEILDEQCGIVVEKGDIGGLISAIDRIIEKKSIKPSKCRERAIKYYDMNDRFEEYVTLMESMKR